MSLNLYLVPLNSSLVPLNSSLVPLNSSLISVHGIERLGAAQAVVDTAGILGMVGRVELEHGRAGLEQQLGQVDVEVAQIVGKAEVIPLTVQVAHRCPLRHAQMGLAGDIVSGGYRYIVDKAHHLGERLLIANAGRWLVVDKVAGAHKAVGAAYRAGQHILAANLAGPVGRDGKHVGKGRIVGHHLVAF